MGEKKKAKCGHLFPDVIDFPGQLFTGDADEFVKEEGVRHEARRVENGNEVVDVAVDPFRHAGVLDLHGHLPRRKRRRKKRRRRRRRSDV